MDTDVRALHALAQAYLDAAHDMDADRFASIFHHASSVTRIGDDGEVSVTPIAAWLSLVRNTLAPSQRGLERHDELLSVDVVRDLALIKLKLEVQPRCF